MSSPSFPLASPSPSLPRPRSLPPFHAMIVSLVVFDPSRIRVRSGKSAQTDCLGLFDPSRTTLICSSSIRRRRRTRKDNVLKAREEDDAFAMGPRILDVEAEIYEFMQNSDKPRDFPTRRELVAAGRADLAEAVAAQGGWLTFGWDLDGDEVNDGLESRRGDSQEDKGVYQQGVSNGSLVSDPVSFLSRSEVAQEDGRVYQERTSNGSLTSDPSSALGSKDHPAAPSSAGRSSEPENVEDGGIEGILSRLEKERSLPFAMGSTRKVVNGWDSWRNAAHDPGDTILFAHQLDVCGNERNSRSESSESEDFFLHDSGDMHSQNGKLKDVNGTKSSMPVMWRSWSLQRAGFSLTDFEAAEIVPTDDRKVSEDNHLNVECRSNNRLKQTQNSFESGNGMNEPAADRGHIQLHLQHLEADLTSAFDLLRSRVNGVVSQKHQENSIDELHTISDAWEFQETEIMNAQKKLRAIRAKLAVLEGKLSLHNMETQKVTEEKQKRIDAAQNALRLLRTTFIVWPNTASEVLLAGSFDGWTGQRRMERSRSGAFSLQLKLYPGRYEIKFIVDGVWKVDPLRPTVHNNGHENNLLIVDC